MHPPLVPLAFPCATPREFALWSCARCGTDGTVWHAAAATAHTVEAACAAQHARRAAACTARARVVMREPRAP